MTDPTHKKPISTSVSDVDRRLIKIASILSGRGFSEFFRLASVVEAEKIIGKYARSNAKEEDKARLREAEAEAKKFMEEFAAKAKAKLVDAPKPEKGKPDAAE